MQYTKDVIGPANLAKLKTVQDWIVSGRIQVPSTPDELKSYLVSLNTKKM